MAKIKYKFDRHKQCNCASLFQSFLDHFFENVIPDTSNSHFVREDIYTAYNRTIAKMLRRGKAIRKPVRVIAVNDMDSSIVRGVKRTIDETQSSVMGFERPAQLLWTILNPTIQIIRALGNKRYVKRRKLGKDIESDLILMGEFVSPIYEKKAIGKPLHDIVHNVMNYLVDQSTFDGGIFVADMLDSESTCLFPTPIIGIAKEVREKDFKIDSGMRPAYGIGMLNHGDLKWLELEHKGKQLPVYIQKHALSRLIQRTAPLSDSRSTVYIMVCDSVEKPIICSRDRNRFLLECRVHDQKLGYFSCRALDNAILITTFLFLTMDGTPEGERLWYKLRLDRQDKEYLGLDSLQLFVNSDLRSDIPLSRMLGECNCGHLLKIKNDSNKIISGVADDIRNYLSCNQRIPESVTKVNMDQYI